MSLFLLSQCVASADNRSICFLMSVTSINNKSKCFRGVRQAFTKASFLLSQVGSVRGRLEWRLNSLMTRIQQEPAESKRENDSVACTTPLARFEPRVPCAGASAALISGATALITAPPLRNTGLGGDVVRSHEMRHSCQGQPEQ